MASVPEVLPCAGEALRRYGFPEGHPLSVDRQQAFLGEAQRHALLEELLRGSWR